MANPSDSIKTNLPRILFVMDPLEKIGIRGDSTWMLMLEAQSRGAPIAFCTPQDLFVRGGQAWARTTFLSVSWESPHFRCESPSDLPLGHFDLVWMRKDPPFHMGYIFSTYLLELVPAHTLVLNNPASIRTCNEKLFTLQFPQFVTETLITHEVSRILQFAADAPDRIVLKPWDGNGGRGVLVSRHGDPNLRSMAEILTEEERSFIIVQHYVPEIIQGDKRIILVDGEPKGWMLRVPQAGDHRGNMHAGARVEACELSPRDQEVCAALQPELRRRGLLFVGIDMIGPCLTEINVTSPTGIQEINRLMGLRLEADVTDAAFAALARHRGGQ